MLKKTKLYVAIALMVQSISLFALFLSLWAKKKSIAGAFLAVAALEGATGGYLLWQMKQEADLAKRDNGELDIDDDRVRSELGVDSGTAEDIPLEIPCDEDATEADFHDFN